MQAFAIVTWGVAVGHLIWRSRAAGREFVNDAKEVHTGSSSVCARSPPRFKRKKAGIGGLAELARSERFELPTLGFEVRCSIQLSYERVRGFDYQTWPNRAT